jgi:uncharacterized caspase-like protein
MMETDWALVVGINSYPWVGVDPLEGAVHDAERFHQWVINEQGGAVDPNQTLLLTSPAGAAAGALPRPVFSEIYQFFENLLAVLGNGSGRRLYVYLSGHGISPTVQDPVHGSVSNAALLMANAKAPNLWFNFAGNIWAKGAHDAARFREVVLIMDCCRDLKNNATSTAHCFGELVEDSKDCRLIEAYATGWASKARELPFPPANQKQGVFTHSLLEVLSSGRMTGGLLKESVKKHLGQVLKDEKKAQEPQFNPDDDLARVIFNEKADPPRTPVTIQGHPADPPLIELWPEGADRSTPASLTDWSYHGSSWRGTLEPGQYELRLPAGGGRRLKVLAAIPEEVVL